MTTANGIMDHEEARRKKVGGKVLGRVGSSSSSHRHTDTQTHRHTDIHTFLYTLFTQVFFSRRLFTTRFPTINGKKKKALDHCVTHQTNERCRVDPASRLLLLNCMRPIAAQPASRRYVIHTGKIKK